MESFERPLRQEKAISSHDLEEKWKGIQEAPRETSIENLDAQLAQFVREFVSLSNESGFRVVPAKPPWKMSNQPNMYVRNEDITRVIEALFENQDITIAPSTETNAALATNSGIDTAFSWGHHGKGVRVVYGFSRDAVYKQTVEPSESDLRSIPDAVSVTGVVKPSEIVFVIMRAPRHAFPEELLTDEEFDLPESGLVYRLVVPTQNKTTPQ